MLGTMDTKLETMVEDLHIRMTQNLWLPLMAYSSSNSGYDYEVKSCSKACEESYARLKKLYDDQRDKLGDASVEITAYTLALKKVEAQLLCHQQNQLAYEQKIRFMKIDLDDKSDVLAYHKKLLVEALKEKEDLKTKFKNWQNSSKNLSKLLNTLMSANDKFGLWYADYRYGSILSYENEVLQSVFMNKASDLEDTIDHPHKALKDRVIIDSGCSRHMTGNKAHLVDYQEFKGGSVAFKGSNGRITGEGNIKSGRLDFEDVYCVEELKHYNLFFVSQMYDKKNKVLFTNTDCLVMSVDFKLPNENQVLFKILRQHNMYSFNLKNIDPSRDLACLFAKASIDDLTNENQANKSAGPKEANNSACTQENDDQGAISEVIYLNEEHFVLPIWSAYSTTVKSSEDKIEKNTGFKTCEKPYVLPNDPSMPHLEDIYASPSEGIFTDSSYDDEGVVSDFNNLETTNKKDERGVVVRNNARLVAQGRMQEEGIDYDEVFAPVARIEVIRIFLAFDSYMGFIVYQMDVKSAFLYGTINEEVYVSQPPGFVDPKFPNKVYKVVKALYGLHQSPRAWYATLSTFLEKSGYKRGAIDKTLFIMKDKKDIMLVQVYVDDIIFGSTKKSWCDEFEELMKNRFQMSSMDELTFFLRLQTSSTPIKTQKPLVKDKEAADMDVTPKTSHLHAVKRIFTYLKGQPKLGLWYPKVSLFDLEVYSDSDCAGANLDRKSTTGEAEYVAAAHCCGKVLWIQNQLLDYGFNFMNIKIYIDNESTICIVKNPVFYSKTKHIKIRHHFIRDAYEMKLIQVLKIHTDDNVADLLTKAFDVSRFNFLVVNIRLLNL
nr:hypothetical protein [Tanacetum cinerariifolium]